MGGAQLAVSGSRGRDKQLKVSLARGAEARGLNRTKSKALKNFRREDDSWYIGVARDIKHSLNRFCTKQCYFLFNNIHFDIKLKIESKNPTKQHLDVSKALFRSARTS